MSDMIETLGLDTSKDGASWHGKENPMNGLQTAEQVEEFAGLHWLVQQMKTPHPMAYIPHPSIPDVFILNPEVPQYVPGYMVNMRDTDKVVLGYVGERYKIIQNWEAFSFIDNLVGNKDAKFNSAGCLYNKYGAPSRIFISAELQPTKVMGDDFRNYIVFTHSHDGMNAVRAFVTPIRVVCNNTLTLAIEGTKRTWATNHVGSIEAKLQASQETLKLYKDYMAVFPVYAEKMAGFNLYDIEVGQILDVLFPDDGTQGNTRMSANAAAMRRSILMSYEERQDSLKFHGTAWGLIQAATNVLGNMIPLRQTKHGQINREFKAVEGHPVVDRLQRILDSLYEQENPQEKEGEEY